MEVILDPTVTGHVYYLVPRIRVNDSAASVKYTLGLLTPDPAVREELSVSFVRLPPCCGIFANQPRFVIQDEQDVCIPFQYKRRGNVPELHMGTSAEDAHATRHGEEQQQ
uniref:Uncharacterized protein n=1 Tax=Lygus hesperus TaxID=30085 RepID=A0A146L8Z0_LYGHE